MKLPVTAPGRSKYGAIRTEVDGIVFDSKREAARYRELCLLERGGVIAGLRRQVRFPLVVDGVRVATYVADFCYSEGGDPIVEDCKGVRTPVYRLKAKLMTALYGVVIRET